jgi:DNA end-binding protein Ku
MMPRSIWNGTIAVGLVNVPIKLYSATDSKTVHFHEVHEADGARVEHRRFCSKEDREVPYEEIVKGFEVAPDEYVALDKDEIAAAAGERSRIIDVDACVCAGDVDPVFFDKTYYLGPGDDGDAPYKVLHAALERTGRAALGRFTFHNREYLAAIRPLDRILALHTMRFADELVPAADIEVRRPSTAPGDREVGMAERLVESMHEDFRPAEHHDEYREAVLAMIERKAAGEDIEPPAEEPSEEPPDLMAALEASLKGGGARGGGRSRSRRGKKARR